MDEKWRATSRRSRGHCQDDPRGASSSIGRSAAGISRSARQMVEDRERYDHKLTNRAITGSTRRSRLCGSSGLGCSGGVALSGWWLAGGGPGSRRSRFIGVGGDQVDGSSGAWGHGSGGGGYGYVRAVEESDEADGQVPQCGRDQRCVADA